MRISTVREFRDKATGLRSRTPILVTRRGRLAGIFFPRPEITLPIELKRELFDMLSSDVLPLAVPPRTIPTGAQDLTAREASTLSLPSSDA
jgi:hypothetical protein